MAILFLVSCIFRVGIGPSRVFSTICLVTTSPLEVEKNVFDCYEILILKLIIGVIVTETSFFVFSDAKIIIIFLKIELALTLRAFVDGMAVTRIANKISVV